MPSATIVLSVPQHRDREAGEAEEASRWGELAREIGCDALLVEGRVPLFGPNGTDADERFAVPEGVAIYREVDLARFPLDHPLVVSHPEAFTIRRESAEAVIDPRRPMPAAGEALARLRNAETAEIVIAPIAESLARLVDRGVTGFRLLEPQRLAPELIAALRARLPGIRLIAGPLAGDRNRARALAEALDHLVSSFAWWDYRASWLVEEREGLRGAAPLLAELRPDASIPERALGAAAATADGLILPAELLHTPHLCAAAARAVRQARALAEFSGGMRQLTGPAAPVTALLRADAPDLREAGQAAVILINSSAETADVPSLPAVLQPAGIALCDFESLDGDGAPDAPLGPGEVRVLKGSRAASVILPRNTAGDAAKARDWPRLVVEEVTPSVDGGDFDVKRVVGDTLTVRATIYTDGHEQLAAELRWRAADAKGWSTARMAPLANDVWQAEFPLERLGRHEFSVEAWLDRYGGFRRDLAKKRAAEVDQPVDHAEGRALIEEAMQRAKGRQATALKSALRRAEAAPDLEASAEALLDEDLAALMNAVDDRPHALRSPVQRVDAERIAARFSSWYELFPRSQTDEKTRHGTFADVIGQLPRVREMGFDTLYFPPIHPIGKTNRKGPNNTLTPGPDDPGSPYAIGSAEGGHDAIHPELGSFEDFDRLVAAAHEHGLEIALDFAIQASPDHPWLGEHPGWFAWRPDGSMKYAENPPKKYQDIVNVDFYGPDAVPGLWTALRDVILLWVEHGVKTFRVDNPHTKPLPFWEWMIADVRARHPEVIFLSEAFTRPTMMYRLAKAGFSQSYTYFTWRDRKHELIDYVTELTTTAPKEFYRPHFFVNTPDINPFFLQTSGRPGFQIRAVLAATLSGLWGVYSGFELCESEPLGPGKEEYLDSEKFEVRPRDWNTPGNIVEDVTLLNRLRRAHPALQTHLNTRFYEARNDNILWYGKLAPDGSEMIVVMVNLDPHHAQECDFDVPLWEFGLPDDGTIQVEDLQQGHRFAWHGKYQHIRIAPDLPYRIWRLFPEDRA